jgi:hypothetical protein
MKTVAPNQAPSNSNRVERILMQWMIPALRRLRQGGAGGVSSPRAKTKDLTSRVCPCG